MVDTAKVVEDGVVSEAGPGVNASTAGGNGAFRNWNNEFAHITDRNERQAAIIEGIEGKPWTRSTYQTLAVAGAGFFVDSYDVFSIGLVAEMLGIVYGRNGKLDDNSDMSIKIATPIGTLLGQLALGWMGDRFGRRAVYGIGLILIILSTVMIALTASAPGLSIFPLLTFWRVVMGVGIGGDYPLSATIISEYASTRWRGLMINLVFAMQGIGQLGVGIIMLLVTVGFGRTLEQTVGNPAQCADNQACVTAVDRMWRIIVGFGAVPACATVYSRLTMAETPRYSFEIAERKTERQHLKESKSPNGPSYGLLGKARTLHGRFRIFCRHPGLLKHVVATSASWFLLDIAFYGLNMNAPIILKAIGWSEGESMFDKFMKTATGYFVLTACAVPGYFISAATIDWIGRRPIQLLGFVVLTILFAIIAGMYWTLSAGGLLALYSLSQFFFNFGPNSTTFVIPAEIFPTRYRSTLHGISAASGKLGAIIAQVVIFKVKSFGADPVKAEDDIRWATPGVQKIMGIFAGIMFIGGLFTLLLPETKQRSLEDLGRLAPVGDLKELPSQSSGDEVTPS